VCDYAAANRTYAGYFVRQSVGMAIIRTENDWLD
jgi:hypothetical protein